MWDQPRDLDEVLVELRRLAVTGVKMRLGEGLPPLTACGSTIDEIDEQERRLGRPIPEDIRKLYAMVGGVSFEGGDRYPPQTGHLLPLHEIEWAGDEYLTSFELFVGRELRWKRAEYFVFARYKEWDFITYCTSPARGRPGAIVLLEDDYANEIPSEASSGDRLFPIVLLGDALANWLARWIACGLEEWVGFRPIELPRELETKVLRDHLRLNPTVPGVSDRLAELEGP